MIACAMHGYLKAENRAYRPVPEKSIFQIVAIKTFLMNGAVIISAKRQAIYRG